MKTLMIIAFSALTLNASFASCIKQVEKDAVSRTRLFLQDTIEIYSVKQIGTNRFEVYSKTQLDPEYTYVEGTYSVEYNAECREISYTVTTPMTEGSNYPDRDYTRSSGNGAPCDHCGDENDQ
jgi:hypothetical protein